MRFLTALALTGLCVAAFGGECENVPAVLELELTAGTNREDVTFFGCDFDRPITEYPHRGDDLWCKTGTVCRRSGLAVEMEVFGIRGMKKGADGPTIGRPCTTHWLRVYRVEDAQGK